MILVDTSVWVDHFRNTNLQLIEILHRDAVCCHPLIIGELACGNLANRTEILTRLKSLPQTAEVTHAELLIFIEENNLPGRGIGYVDTALLASAILSDVVLWTLDKKLNTIAAQFQEQLSLRSNFSLLRSPW